MPKRYYRKLTDAATGLPFLFALENGRDGPLHITLRHATFPGEAVDTFVEGVTTWNAVHQRFETSTATHELYWAWHASGAVLVSVAFGRETDDGPA